MILLRRCWIGAKQQSLNHSLHDTNSYGTQDKDKQNKNTTHVLDTTMRKQTYVYNMCINNWFICRNKRHIKRIKTYYLELMLSICILVYTSTLI
jgi:hypothetical protein